MTRKEFTPKYGQIILPLVTSYDANEDIENNVYRNLIEYLIKNDPAILSLYQVQQAKQVC